MRSTVSTPPGARPTAQSQAARAVARVGLAARGVLYILIGWVAILVALGEGKRQANQQGALQLLAGTPFGVVLLWLIALGFAGYALWRLSEVLWGTVAEGSGVGARLKSLCRAAIYAFLAYLTFTIIIGSQGNETRHQQDMTASAMRHPGGQWAVGIIGLVIVIVGITLVVQGVRRRFLRYFQLGRLGRRERRAVEVLGTVGTTARGIVFAIAGALVLDAAVTHSPGKSGGLDKALLTLQHQPFGEFLLAIAALGLVVFGLYGLCEARWRRV